MRNLALASVLAVLAGTMTPAIAHEAAPCPSEIKRPTHCYTGKDVNGSIYWIALPQDWNKILVVHAHGGPRIRQLGVEGNARDLGRYAVIVNAGYAWVHSSFRQPGFAVRAAAQDTDIARQLFVARFGKPRLTLLHGQSWGGNVAAKLMEMQASEMGGAGPFDGALITNGTLAGGVRGYDFRMDLRAVYQFYCNNHPRKNEPQYALNLGLPAGATLDLSDLIERLRECTGYRLKEEVRTPQQRRNMANILNVARIAEQSVFAHMAWATYMFADIAHNRMGGRSPFGNMNVRYGGSDDDEALNRGVARFAPDPQAVKQMAHDADLSGIINAPVLTLNAVGDRVAFVESSAHYRDRVLKAGHGDLLLQAFVNESMHSGLPPAVYPALLDTLVTWIDTRKKPDQAALASRCEYRFRTFGGICSFLPDYVAPPYDQRVRPR